ncbi:MAG: hypothetical protein P8J50_09225 [Acidimicrobiales bacterium]|nr:hypothetical protein [Acidimicrobiales bacterium]
MARRLILVVLLLAAACAEDVPPSMSQETVEAVLPGLIWPADSGLVLLPTCPAVPDSPVAREMVCTANLDGDHVSVEIEVDDTGAVTGQVVEPLFDLSVAAGQLSDRLAVDLGIEAPLVSCDRAVVVARAGREVACIATREESPILFTFRLLDAEGGWTVEIAQ